MRNIKLTLEYDGAEFFGFQKQPHHVTIQEALEKALSKVLNQKTKIAAASGRTDTGVHALEQVVNFKTKSLRKIGEIQKGLNAYLPKQVAVRKVEDVPFDFHSRYSAKSKTYEYLIWNDPIRSPLKASRAWHVREPLNLTQMKKAARFLTGRHNFKAFTASGGSAKEMTRTLKQIQIKKQGNSILFIFEADGFLYHMVRNMVGTLVQVGRGKLMLSEMYKILHSQDRKKAGVTAPAEGLTLIFVTY
ncbi:MAG: tRNA pseudouridine(38-40) synthase TruA [Candidatus Omnitrophica bacterium]|nr:tRNA pseudouridine(38-40) synthase TruA [Candidatus Omnitrophota bacterium]